MPVITMRHVAAGPACTRAQARAPRSSSLIVAQRRNHEVKQGPAGALAQRGGPHELIATRLPGSAAQLAAVSARGLQAAPRRTTTAATAGSGSSWGGSRVQDLIAAFERVGGKAAPRPALPPPSAARPNATPAPAVAARGSSLLHPLGSQALAATRLAGAGVELAAASARAMPVAAGAAAAAGINGSNGHVRDLVVAFEQRGGSSGAAAAAVGGAPQGAAAGGRRRRGDLLSTLVAAIEAGPSGSKYDPFGSLLKGAAKLGSSPSAHGAPSPSTPPSSSAPTHSPSATSAPAALSSLLPAGGRRKYDILDDVLEGMIKFANTTPRSKGAGGPAKLDPWRWVVPAVLGTTAQPGAAAAQQRGPAKLDPLDARALQSISAPTVRSKYDPAQAFLKGEWVGTVTGFVRGATVVLDAFVGLQKRCGKVQAQGPKRTVGASGGGSGSGLGLGGAAVVLDRMD